MIKVILLISVFLVTLIKSSGYKLLDENKTGSKTIWTLNDDARKFLTKDKWANKPFHVLAIGGPTRSGKSFVMSKMLEKIHNDKKANGKVHFGIFNHKATDVSVTVGIDFGIVEINGQMIVLLDCEGLNSLSKKMDPTLMVIMSMISQKFVYMTAGALNQHIITGVEQMIVNRDLASNGSTYQYPLDTLYFMVNMLAVTRDPNFLTKNGALSLKVKNSFPRDIRLLFVDDQRRNQPQFETDIESFYNLWTSDTPSFRAEGNTLTLGEFAAYIDGVLTSVNNQDFNFSNVLTATYEQFARNAFNKIIKKNKTALKCKPYYTKDQLYKKLGEIDNVLNEFKNAVANYHPHINNVFNDCVDEFERMKRDCELTNEEKGKEIDPKRTKKEKLEEVLSKSTKTISGNVGENATKSGGMIVGGAAIGSECGTLCPGLGNVVGGVIGGVVGGVSSIFVWEKDVSRTVVEKKITWKITYVCYNGECRIEYEDGGIVETEY